MGQTLVVPKTFNSSRTGVYFPDWFIFDHDIIYQDVRNALSFLSISQLIQPDIYDIYTDKQKNATALYLYIFHRLGVICPELIRVSLKVDEDASISFRDYEEEGQLIGKSFITLLFDTLPATLSKASSKIELHSQACRIVKHLSDNSISASFFLEIINTVLSAVALFTKIRYEDAGVQNLLTIYSYLYEIFYELHCFYYFTVSFLVEDEQTSNVTLCQVIVANDQLLLEWIPTVLTTGYYVIDQLTQWLILIINISFYNM